MVTSKLDDTLVIKFVRWYHSVIQLGRNLANSWNKNTTLVLKRSTWFSLRESKVNKNESRLIFVFFQSKLRTWDVPINIQVISLLKWSISIWLRLFALIYHLSYTSMLPLHVGTLLLHVPSRHVILTVPVNLKLAWQVNETFFPWRKSKPILRPFCGLPGSVQDSENFK